MTKKIKILLVEDDPFLLGMYGTKFEIEGFSVITADNGADGLEAADRERPDIILLDIVLPRMNGLEVLAKLKADKATAGIPVIVLTNLNQRDEIERGVSLGADDYLVKAHFSPAEVVGKIKKILSGDQALS